MSFLRTPRLGSRILPAGAARAARNTPTSPLILAARSVSKKLGNLVASTIEDLSMLPPGLSVLFAMNVLSSFKYFSFALAMPLLATDEFGLSDTSAGTMYGVWGLLLTIYMLPGSLLVDRLGVRNCACLASALGVVARALVVLARRRSLFLLAVFGLSPLADGLLEPIFTVGVKRMTPPGLQPIAYAFLYTVMNLGGALSDVAAAPRGSWRPRPPRARPEAGEAPRGPRRAHARALEEGQEEEEAGGARGGGEPVREQPVLRRRRPGDSAEGCKARIQPCQQ